MTAAKQEANTGQITDNSSKPEDFEKKIFPGKKMVNKMLGKNRWKRKLFLLFIWGTLIFVALLSYPFLKGLQVSPVMPPVSRQASPLLPEVKRFPVQNDRSIKFDSFIIPFEEHGRFTYISLSISFDLPNKKLMEEMTKKKAQIRGIVYNLLSKNISILTNVSSLEKLKELITNNVNGVLTAGKVDEPIIFDFSTV
jgi:flagellar basal body-associated protein FliL